MTTEGDPFHELFGYQFRRDMLEKAPGERSPLIIEFARGSSVELALLTRAELDALIHREKLLVAALETIRSEAAFGLSFGAGNDVGNKDAALRSIYRITTAPAKPTEAPTKNRPIRGQNILRRAANKRTNRACSP